MTDEKLTPPTSEELDELELWRQRAQRERESLPTRVQHLEFVTRLIERADALIAAARDSAELREEVERLQSQWDAEQKLKHEWAQRAKCTDVRRKAAGDDE